jgi:hypothetical protein
MVVKHASGISGLVRMRPPDAMTGLSPPLAHSVWRGEEGGMKVSTQAVKEHQSLVLSAGLPFDTVDTFNLFYTKKQ